MPQWKAERNLTTGGREKEKICYIGLVRKTKGKTENVYSAQSGVTALLHTGQSENLKLWQIFWLHKYWQSSFLFLFLFGISVGANRQEFAYPLDITERERERVSLYK